MYGGFALLDHSLLVQRIAGKKDLISTCMYRGTLVSGSVNILVYFNNSRD